VKDVQQYSLAGLIRLAAEVHPEQARGIRERGSDVLDLERLVDRPVTVAVQDARHAGESIAAGEWGFKNVAGLRPAKN